MRATTKKEREKKDEKRRMKGKWKVIIRMTERITKSFCANRTYSRRMAHKVPKKWMKNKR